MRSLTYRSSYWPALSALYIWLAAQAARRITREEQGEVQVGTWAFPNGNGATLTVLFRAGEWRVLEGDREAGLAAFAVKQEPLAVFEALEARLGLPEVRWAVCDRCEGAGYHVWGDFSKGPVQDECIACEGFGMVLERGR